MLLFDIIKLPLLKTHLFLLCWKFIFQVSCKLSFDVNLYSFSDYPFFPMPRNGVRSMIPPHFQPPSLPPVFSDHLRGALSPSETDSMLSSRTDNLMFKPGSNNSAPSYF